MTKYTQNFGLALPDFRQGPWHDLVNSDLTKIDALLYSALSGANVQVWDNDVEYHEGVTTLDDTDASIWMAGVNHTSSPEPMTFAEERLANPTYWVRLLTGFAPRGEWLNSTVYFPYDLVYDSALGIMALCTLKHTSNDLGNIKDDAIYWAFLIDMSNSDLSTAIAVTYDDSTSGLGDNVQAALDQLEVQIIALNNVNVSQGTAISNLTNADVNFDMRIDETESDISDLKDVDTSTATTLANMQTQINDLQDQIDDIPTVTFPTGTRMTFIQSVPPTGWTQSTAYNDRAIRIVSGSTGGTAGGAVAFSSVFANTRTGGHALTIPQMPNHSHPVGGVWAAGPPNEVPGYVPLADSYGKGSTVSDAVGGNQAHDHAMDLRVLYVDACVGVKV